MPTRMWEQILENTTINKTQEQKIEELEEDTQTLPEPGQLIIIDGGTF